MEVDAGRSGSERGFSPAAPAAEIRAQAPPLEPLPRAVISARQDEEKDQGDAASWPLPNPRGAVLALRPLRPVSLHNTYSIGGEGSPSPRYAVARGAHAMEADLSRQPDVTQALSLGTAAAPGPQDRIRSTEPTDAQCLPSTLAAAPAAQAATAAPLTRLAVLPTSGRGEALGGQNSLFPPAGVSKDAQPGVSSVPQALPLRHLRPLHAVLSSPLSSPPWGNAPEPPDTGQVQGGAASQPHQHFPRTECLSTAAGARIPRPHGQAAPSPAIAAEEPGPGVHSLAYPPQGERQAHWQQQQQHLLRPQLQLPQYSALQDQPQLLQPPLQQQAQAQPPQPSLLLPQQPPAQDHMLRQPPGPSQDSPSSSPSTRPSGTSTAALTTATAGIGFGLASGPVFGPGGQLNPLNPADVHVEVTVAIRVGSIGGRRARGTGSVKGPDEESRSGYERGPVCGLFDVNRYMADRDCIFYNGKWLSRSSFEKAGGSKMAKWYKSIRVTSNLEPLGEWLERHNLPVARGPSRRSSKRVPDGADLQALAQQRWRGASAEAEAEAEGDYGASPAAAAPTQFPVGPLPGLEAVAGAGMGPGLGLGARMGTEPPAPRIAAAEPVIGLLNTAVSTPAADPAAEPPAELLPAVPRLGAATDQKFLQRLINTLSPVQSAGLQQPPPQQRQLQQQQWPQQQWPQQQQQQQQHPSPPQQQPPPYLHSVSQVSKPQGIEVSPAMPGVGIHTAPRASGDMLLSTGEEPTVYRQPPLPAWPLASAQPAFASLPARRRLLQPAGVAEAAGAGGAVQVSPRTPAVQLPAPWPEQPPSHLHGRPAIPPQPSTQNPPKPLEPGLVPPPPLPSCHVSAYDGAGGAPGWSTALPAAAASDGGMAAYGAHSEAVPTRVVLEPQRPPLAQRPLPLEPQTTAPPSQGYWRLQDLGGGGIGAAPVEQEDPRAAWLAEEGEQQQQQQPWQQQGSIPPTLFRHYLLPRVPAVRAELATREHVSPAGFPASAQAAYASADAGGGSTSGFEDRVAGGGLQEAAGDSVGDKDNGLLAASRRRRRPSDTDAEAAVVRDMATPYYGLADKQQLQQPLQEAVKQKQQQQQQLQYAQHGWNQGQGDVQMREQEVLAAHQERQGLWDPGEDADARKGRAVRRRVLAPGGMASGSDDDQAAGAGT